VRVDWGRKVAARAIWKGVIRMQGVSVPVKVFSARNDRSVHFRLLHEPDRVPVKQELVNPETGETVDYDQVQRGFTTDDGDVVILSSGELEELEPEASRDIDVVAFLPSSEIDHRWYSRPYYLGPDGNSEKYWALVHALEKTADEGLARWTMRKKEYVGALRLYRGYPMLITLRNASDIIPLEAIELPEGPQLDERELNMAHQLIGMLEASFDPAQFRDEYRDRVLDLVERKAQGEEAPVLPKRPRPKKSDDLTEALQASLERIRA